MIASATIEAFDEITGAMGVHLDASGRVNDNSRVIFMDGVAVAMYGTMMMWPGVAQIWGLVVPERASGRGIALTKETKSLLNYLIKRDNLRQVRCLAHTFEAAQWLYLLGFEPEGRWREAGPNGEDLWMMVFHRRN